MFFVPDEREQATTMTVSIKKEVSICNGCDAKAKKPRLPRGWKRHQGETLCKQCWNKRYVLKAIAFPVAGPVGISWEEFRKILDQCWADSTGLANWTVNELLKADTPRHPNDEKIGKHPHPYLYPGA